MLLDIFRCHAIFQTLLQFVDNYAFSWKSVVQVDVSKCIITADRMRHALMVRWNATSLISHVGKIEWI